VTKLSTLSRIAVLALAAGTLAQAQDADKGLSAEFKLRTGYALGSNDDHLANRTVGFGLNFGYGLSFGRLSAEVGFQYKPGDQYLLAMSSIPSATGAPRPDPAYSVDSRKNTLSGVTLRLGIERGIADSWGWKAGLQLGGARFRQEYLGDVGDTGWSKYEDTYNGTPTKSDLGLAPFAGISYRFNQASSLEVNLINITYKRINYVHVAGAVLGTSSAPGNSTLLDYLETRTKNGLHVEVGYVFRF